ncbi:RIP metalloprotease RseP [Luteithermobacter gelatinilyticus]|uniref:RIP metalloprotease RseP n=1 Tax=Luteithermobacter gelatinilyticus TaxID=2582913 RepID=UPI0011069D6F|nr:RIP metalloprotease RseP [Luteithermobacter gelatinilyticus]|tara:strand:+ start:11365 stop:12474 length:1110 start_codon:yes stop_codon:yes gene_type:complete
MDTLFSFIFYAGAFIVALSVLVFIHEWGHYIVARMCGVRVEVFSIGFGREIWGWTDRKGTRWKISYIPLGGYVKFFGDASAASTPDGSLPHMSEEERKVAFHYKSLPQRAAIVFAGPFANLLLAVLILASFYITFGQIYTPPIVDEVVPGSPAEQAGLQPNDRIVSVDGVAVESFNDIKTRIMLNLEEPVSLEIDRGGRLIEVSLTPRLEEVDDGYGNIQRVALIGVRSVGRSEIRELSVPAAFWAGVERTWDIIQMSFRGLGQILFGDRSAKELGGPIKIAQVVSQSAEQGIFSYISIIAMISINLGIINLLPIPMLDGGHLLFYGFEAALGRKLSEKTQELGFRIGLILILGLMVFATLNDIMGLVG